MNFFHLLPILEKLFMSFKLGGNNASPLIFFFQLKYPQMCYNHTSFYCTLLNFTSQILFFFFNKFKIYGNLVVNMPFFPHNFCSLHVFVSYFGSSCNLSHFFIIIIVVMAICDQ